MTAGFTNVESLGQIVTFLFSVLTGAGLCVFYDLFRSVRRAFPHSKVAVFFEDLFFWLVCAIVIFLFLLVRCSGHVRVFVLIGATAGFTLWFFTVGKLLTRLLSGLLIKISFVFLFIKRCLTVPFRWITNHLKRLFIMCKNLILRLKPKKKKEKTAA